jgi:hypothetical protein
MRLCIRLSILSVPGVGVEEVGELQLAEVLCEGDHLEGVQAQAQAVALHLGVVPRELLQVRGERLRRQHKQQPSDPFLYAACGLLDASYPQSCCGVVTMVTQRVVYQLGSKGT